MKRTGELWRLIASEEALYAAHLKARKGKRNRNSCFRFEANIGARISTLVEQLNSGKYRPKEGCVFEIFEPKRRVIDAPAYSDLVVQHALCAAIGPVMEAKFHRANFACRVGYGTHACADYLQNKMRSAPVNAWTLHVDVRKYFYRIDRSILFGIYKRHIKCKKTLSLISIFLTRKDPIGMPIGHMISQLSALVYLNELDQFIARKLKPYSFCRYMDDTILICSTRVEAEFCYSEIERFLKEKLALEVSKYTIAPINKGVNFSGYRTWRSTRFIRKYTITKARRIIRAGKLEALVSLLGHAKKTASRRHIMNYCKRENYALYIRLPESHRRIHDISDSRGRDRISND